MFLTEAGCLLFILYISGVEGQTNSICAFKGSSVNLSCSGGDSAADNEYKWFTNFMKGSSKSDFHEVVVDGNQKKYRISKGSRPTLTINDLNKNDEKLYVCCESADKQEICSKNQTQLYVEELQVKVLPSKHGQTVTLMCSSRCPFTQRLTGFIWFKNRQFLYQDWSPWYQELVSGEEKVTYSCAVKGYEDFRAPEVSVDLVTSACFRVTYAGGSMCSSSGNKQCSIIFPTEIFLHQTPPERHHVKLTCSSNSNCSLTEPQASIVLLKNRKTETERKPFPVTSTDIFTCAVKDVQDIHSADVCVDDGSCWTVNCSPKRICALKGSSLNISCKYSHPQDQQQILKHWFKINRNVNQKEKEIKENKNEVKLYDNPNQHNLGFEKLSQNHSGEYVFKIGKELKESTFPEVTLIVTDLRVQIRPSSEVTEGQKVTLTCSTSCPLTHSSNFHWYLNHQPLKVENKHLVIDAVTSKDAGKYSCVVKTKENFMSPVKSLTVKSINTTTQTAVVGGVSAVASVLVIICFAVFLWIRKKRTSASSPETANNLHTLNSDHLYEEILAKATDDKRHCTQVNHENTVVYSTIQAHQEQGHVPYAITKFRQKSDLETDKDVL